MALARVRPMYLWTQEKMQFMLCQLICKAQRGTGLLLTNLVDRFECKVIWQPGVDRVLTK